MFGTHRDVGGHGRPRSRRNGIAPAMFDDVWPLPFHRRVEARPVHAFWRRRKKRNRASIDLVWVFSRVRNPSKPANRNYALANFDLPACGVTSASRGYEERDTCHSAFVVRSEIDSFSGRLRASFHLQPLTQAVPSLRFGVPSSFSSTSSRSSPSCLLFPPLPPLRVPKHPLHVGYIQPSTFLNCLHAKHRLLDIE